VLDLKAPETPEPADLFGLWRSYLIYRVSFVFVAMYWINHRGVAGFSPAAALALYVLVGLAYVVPASSPSCRADEGR
jgi:uncharacterized membrane protein